MIHLLTFVLAAAISLVVTLLVRRIAVARGVFDLACTYRKIHSGTVPRLGGVGIISGIYGALTIGLLVSPIRGALERESQRITGLALAALSVAALGLYDDLRGIRARDKLAVQLTAATLLYLAGVRVEVVQNPFGPDLALGALAMPVTLLWVMGLSNALNLIDGLDGLAAGISLAGAFAVFLIGAHGGDTVAMLVSSAALGGVAGFLVYNLNPASIFMGDTGSLFLGLVFAALTLRPHGHAGGGAPLVAMTVVLGIPIADTLLAALRRLVRGVPPFSPDREHVHHRLIDMGLTHRQAVLVLWACAAVLSAAGVHIACGAHGRWITLAVVTGAAGVGLARLGMFMFTSPGLRSRRAINRELFGVVRRASRRIRSATRVAEVHEALMRATPALNARSLRLHVSAELETGPFLSTNTHGEAGACTRYMLNAMSPEFGELEVVWAATGSVLGRDAEIAFELLCQEVAAALRRIQSGRNVCRAVELGQGEPSAPKGALSVSTRPSVPANIVALDEGHVQTLREATPRRVEILGVPVDAVDMASAVGFADRAVRKGERALCVLAVNPEKVVTLSKDPWLRTFFHRGALLIPDGIGVVWAARLLKRASIARVPGADLMQELCALAARRGYPVYLFGAREEVSAAAGAELQARFPSLRIAGRANGYWPAEEAHTLVDAINRSGAQILFVALGSPRQEQWIAEHGPELQVSLIQGIGGTLDTIAGHTRRAPRSWQRLNLEWLYRLLEDPRRIRRQSALLVFAWRVLKSWRAASRRAAMPIATGPRVPPAGGSGPARVAPSGR